MAKGKRVKKKKISGGRTALIILVIAAAAAAASFALTGSHAAKLETVYPNVTVGGVELGGLTYDEAYNKLLKSDAASAKDMSVAVILTDDEKLVVTGENIGYASSAAEAAELAMNYGKDGGFIANTMSYLKCSFSGVELNSEVTFDEANVRKMISNAALKVNRESKNASYKVSDKDITLIKGGAGYTVPQEDIYNYIYEAFTVKKESCETDEFSDRKLTTTIESVDFKAIYNDIFVEPVSASYDSATGNISESVTGVSFDVSGAEKAYAAASAGDTVTIPIIYTEPEVTSESLQALIFRDELASKSTSLSTSSSNRITNVSNAADAINGTVLQPGDVFSFNGIVGERTAEKGYKLAGAYVAGESVDQLGGGICQVSSTIYYCVLMSQLEVTSRSNHMFSVAYLPLGFDATVNWGTLDFKFKNNQEYPIKIVSYVKDKQLFVEIWGTKLDDTYVKLEYNLIETLDFKTVEKEDESVEQGKTVVKTGGHKGYVVDSYQLIYDGNDNLVSRNFIARNKYKTQDRVILIPIKVEEPEEPIVDPGPDPIVDPEPIPDPEPTPEPTPDPEPETIPEPETEDEDFD